MEQYPRMLHKPDGSKLIVQDVDAEHDAVGKGWQLHATPPPVPGHPVAPHTPHVAPHVAPHVPEPPDEDEARKRRR
jgi:hypothetical protein